MFRRVDILYIFKMLGSLRKSYVLAGQNLLADFTKCSANITGTFLVSNRTFHSIRNSSSQIFFHADASSQTLRWLSQLPTSKPLAASMTVASKDDSREFMALFPDLVRDLTDAGRNLDIPDVTKRFARVVQYNVPGGKKNRAMALYYAYRMLTPESELTQHKIRLAMTMGWCVEMLQAFFLVIDDILDQSDMRRGRPCWYRVDNIGNNAINDGLLLESGVYELLRRHFRDKPYYANVLDLFHSVTLKTVMGQSLDMSTCNNGRPSLEKFTMNLYTAIVKYKTSYYSFYLPIALAMNMAGVEDPEMYRQAKTILLEMGQFFQIQDDFIDTFGTPELSGKVGSDIQEGKCSWLAVVALQRANTEQRRIMEECFGHKDPQKVEAVRQLYETLGLPSTYAIYEEETYNLIKTHIQQVSRGLPVAMFLSMLEMIYKRSG